MIELKAYNQQKPQKSSSRVVMQNIMKNPFVSDGHLKAKRSEYKIPPDCYSRMLLTTTIATFSNQHNCRRLSINLIKMNIGRENINVESPSINLQLIELKEKEALR